MTRKPSPPGLEVKNHSPEKEQEGLAGTSDRLNRLLDTMTERYVETDLSGKILVCNKALADLFGRTKEEAVNLSYTDFMTPDQSGLIFIVYNRVFQTGTPEGINDFEIIRKDGSKTILSATVHPLRDEFGTVVGFATVSKDITKEREIEIAYRQSEESYRKLLELAPDSIVISRLEDAMYLQVNDTFCQRTGYSREEVIGKTALELGLYENPDDLKRLREILGINGRVDGLEICFRHRDGVEANTLVSATRIQYQGQTCMLTISKNITELKNAQKALKTSEQLFRTIVESAQDAIFIKDRWLKYTLVNPAMERLYDIKAADFIGKTDDELFGLPEGKINRNLESRVLLGEIVRMDEEKICGGTHKSFHSIKVPIVDDLGGINGICSFSRDMTDTRKLEDRLIQAQKMEAIGTLAGGIAHDFNNLLAPLVGYTELLKDDIARDSPLQDYLNEILRATSRARDLVKQILTFSRQDEQELKPVRLAPVIEEAVKLLRATLPKTIEMRTTLDQGGGAVMADPSQLHQIIINLATNAFHAMEDSGGVMQIDLKPVRFAEDHWLFPEPGVREYALIKVIDTGMGMEKDTLDKIFDPYFSTKGKNKGTGLGLSVVQGIVTKSGGKIHVTSEPGKGTAFHIYLPLIERFASKSETKESLPIQGGLERILLVDDEEPIVRMQQKILERLGYSVTIRTGSIEALEAFKSKPHAFDLIITDLTMPNMTGIQLLREIKQIRPEISVILCTGFSDQINEEKCRLLNLQGFIMKPVVRREFAEKIRSVLDSQ